MRIERRDLVRTAVERVEKAAPPHFGPFKRRLRSILGQLYTGNPDLHYEIWRRASLGVVEIGLHFEADPLTNARLLGAFRAREAEIRAALGNEPLLEDWDQGWARIYETYPLADDPSLVTRCAERLTAYVRALEPILRQELPEDVPWEPSKRRAMRRRARAPGR